MASLRPKTKIPNPSLVLEKFLPYRLSVLSNRVSGAIAKRYAKQFKLTIPEWRVIAVLGQYFDLTATEIAEATEMDKVAVSRAIARLIAADRVKSLTDPDDNRRQRIMLSSGGIWLHARIAPVALECEARLVASLGPRERAQFEQLLDRLSEAAQRL